MGRRDYIWSNYGVQKLNYLYYVHVTYRKNCMDDNRNKIFIFMWHTYFYLL